ncbi:MAG: YceD family protein [Candidatus Faecivicinus sp.]
MASTLNVTNALKNPGQEYPFEADCSIEEMDVLGDPVRFDNVAAKGTYVGSGETVSLEAVATATVTSRCARCLAEVTLPIAAELHAEFARQPDPENPDQYCFEASTLELTDAIRDALVLELPLRFLCKEDCKGLCPKCGTDLNAGSCTCQEGDDDFNPFAALRSIVENNEEV